MLAAFLPLLAAAAPAPYPAREVLDAFATACSGIENPAVAKASVLAAGWEAIEPTADSRIGRIVSSGIAAMRAQEEADPTGPKGKLADGGIYRRQVAGRELFAVISGVSFDSVSSHGCRVYDLAAPASLSAQELTEWAVREPKIVATGLPGSTKFVWNPGLKPGHMEMEAGFVPEGTRFPMPVAGIPLSGIILTATAIDL